MAGAERYLPLRHLVSIEQHLFVEGVLLKYGFDFRNYAQPSLERRLDSIMRILNKDNLLDVMKLALDEQIFFERILPLMTVGTTEFFRDPEFFRSLREKVFPALKNYPTVNIWTAGCSTGEEVYSLMILLKEEGLFERTTVFATDINAESLKVAKNGIYSLDKMKGFTKNYAEAGGTKSPSDYYVADYGLARVDPGLRENVVFSEHNLVNDGSFRECHLVICRNVLIYFEPALQVRVLQLLHESLVYWGFLGLGSKETVKFSPLHENFNVFDSRTKIFQKNSKALTMNV
jgi:chemotaxis protein methyltransferase CheR